MQKASIKITSRLYLYLFFPEALFEKIRLAVTLYF